MTKTNETRADAFATTKRPGRQPITLLGAPVEAGAGVRGCAMGPAMLRTAGIARALSELGHDVVDLGDIALGHPLAHPAGARGTGAALCRDRRLDP